MDETQLRKILYKLGQYIETIIPTEEIDDVDFDTINKVMNDEVYCNLSLILVDGTDMDLKMIITQENDVTIINGVE